MADYSSIPITVAETPDRLADMATAQKEFDAIIGRLLALKPVVCGIVSRTLFETLSRAAVIVDESLERKNIMSDKQTTLDAISESIISGIANGHLMWGDILDTLCAVVQDQINVESDTEHQYQLGTLRELNGRIDNVSRYAKRNNL